MPYTDYDKYKDGDVTSKSGSPTINRTLTIELDPSVAESTTGTGAWGYDESICADAQDIGVYEPDGSGGWQLAPYQIENPEDIGTTNSVYIHVYSSYVRDGSEQIRVAYGNNSANTDRQTTTVFSNETDNHQTFFHNEASDPVVDYSGNNYDGDGVGITREVAGQIGEGHSADGTDDWIQATNYGGINPDNYTAWTFNYFIKTTESSNNWQIGRRESGNSTNRIDVRSNHDTVNVTSSSGSIGLTITDDTGNFSDRYSETYDNTGVFDGNWHMITVVLNWSGDLKLYIDGTEQSPSASTASYDPSVSAWNSNPLGLMGFADGTADADVLGPHQGDMDMWQFWTSELTQDEITARYEASPLGGHTFFSQQAAVKIKTVSSTHDAVLKNLGAETATAHDAAIQVEDKETAATEDAVIQNRDVEVQSIHDAVLQADLKTQTTHDVVLKNLDAETQATIDTAIQNSDLEASLTEDAVIMKQSEVSTTHDTVLENLDAEKNAVVDAALKKLDKETSLNIDSVVQDADIEVNTTHDTVLKAENQEAAATFDTVLETLDVEATGAWDTAIQDSGLEVTYTVDTVVKSRTDQNFVEDTYIAHGRPGAVTVYIDGTEYKKYANIKVKKRLNEMNDIEFEAFIEDSNDRALLQEGATVEIFEGTDNLLFKGRLNNVEYESNFKAKCEGFGMEVKLLNRKTPRVEYNNTGADDIVKQLVTTEIMQEGTIENAPVASLRFDHDNKLRAIAGTANAVGYDWYISQKKSEGYDKDYLNFVARKGSSTSQKTYDIGNNARMVERNKDTEHVANDITMLGRGDGVNQLEAHVFAASTHRTVTAERLKDTDTTSLDVKDASQLGADGDTVHVRVGTEVIEGTLDVTNNQVDISSRGANDYNGNSTEVITHYKSIQVWLQENVTQGIGPFKPTKSGAEAGSSIDTYGVREEKVTDRTIINKSTLEKVADNELKDRRQDIFRVQIKPTDPRTTKEIELGDTVTAKDLTAMDVNNEFRVVGMDINRASGAEGTVLHLANRPLRLTERLRDIKRETDTTSTHMQGATNIDSQNFVDNADDDHPLTTQFYVPEDAVAVNKLELNLSRDEFRGYVRNEPHSHTVDVTHPSHSHDVTHPSHSHDVSDSTTSTASDVSTNWATSNDYGFISSGGSLTTTISRSNLDVTFSQDYALITVTIYTTNSTSSTNGWDLTVTNDDEGTTLYSDTDIIAGSEKGPVTVQFRETAILDNDQISATLDNNSDEAEDMTVSLNILQVGQHTHDVSISDTSTSALGTTETSTTALGNTVSESSSNSGEPAYGLFSPDTEPKVDVDVFVDGSKVTRITDLGVLGTSSKIDLKTYLSDPVAGSWHELELKPVGNTFKDSFEGLSDGSYPTNWTDTSDLKGEADTAYAQNGSVSFLHDSGGSNVSDGTQAYHNLSADTDVEEFSFWYRETSNSTGGGMSLKDANGKRLLFVGVDNPELQIFSGNGFEYGGNAGPMPWSKNYQVWRKFTVRLNNAKNTFTVDWYDSDSDETRTYGPFPLNSTNQVSRVTVDNQNGASLGGTSSSMVHWTDNVKLGLSRCRLNGSLFSKVFVESKL